MGLIKLIILVAVIIGVVMLWRRFKAWQISSQQTSSTPNQPPLMVRCAECQLHLPKDQAIQAGNQWYCCDAHRAARHHD
ncbi:PP0621 family protein [Halopseudomonas pelagia]|uniref:PP0621 family protein n=1 Tax=Halopseudomonas pelagia TaxID=553151 RepID=UPI0003B46C36|nr:PP0621 family protein [Halopseudomonas pelagia]